MSPVPDVLPGGCHHDFAGKNDSGACFMGIKMNLQIKSRFIRQSVLVFTGIPLLFWALGDFPQRSFLKESLSVLTILGFCQMSGLFFWSRINPYAVKDLKVGRLLKVHKIIGYTCVTLLFFHPFFLVVPRFFESGIAPGQAFVTIITTFRQGVILGMTAWTLMLIMGLTALLRKRLPMRYATWRKFHGITAVLFVFTGAWHAITMGRHADMPLSVLIIILTGGGICFLLRNYVSSVFHRHKEV